ncbi:MAG: glycosyltransferase family 87 protein [Pseudomonadota bacterium]
MSAHTARIKTSSFQLNPSVALAVCFTMLACFSLTGFFASFANTLSDFSAFFVAGKMVNVGDAALAYQLDDFRSAYRDVFPGAPDGYGWFYPPHTFLLHHALSFLPFQIARSVWLAGSFALFLIAMRPWLKMPMHWLLAACAPAIAFHWHSGQTGFLVAALLAFALHGFSLNNRSGDIKAGIAIGLLTLKPHLWLLLPLFLIVERRWRVIAVASAVFAALIAVSVTAYGIEPWRVMLNSATGEYTTNHANEVGLFARMSNLQGLVQFLGWGQAGMAVMLALALSAFAAMFVLSRAGVPFALRAAFMVAASFLIAPHNMIYDHTLFVPVVALLLAPGLLAYGRPIQIAAFLLIAWPALYAFVPALGQFPFGVFVAVLFAFALLLEARTATAR